MARWIQDLKLREPGVVGYTVIAGWWPTTYYRVLTMEMKVATATEGISALTRQLHEMVSETSEPLRDYFLTVVHKTDKFGTPKHADDPDCEVEFASNESAIVGHRRIVQALAQGERYLFRLVADWK